MYIRYVGLKDRIIKGWRLGKYETGQKELNDD